MTGASGAEEHLAAVEDLAENDLVAVQLLRAAGRLHGSVEELAAAVTAWEAIGARFERACTLLLLPARRHEAAEELVAMGCTRPIWFG
ncbi:MAG TPA: hypothetical protein VHT30_01760 [Acidimicrobiales bacterium]|nr:hypothetical protein [Acidimicrobiales bacterium]